MKTLLLLVTICLAFADDERQKTCVHDNVSNALMEFTLRSYKILSSKTASYKRLSPKTAIQIPNLFYSPITVYTTLAELALGARSLTRTHILEGMCLDPTLTDTELHGKYSKLLRSLNREESDLKIKYVNELFITNSAKIQPKYQQNVMDYYNATIHSIDFNDPKRAEEKINTYIQKKSKGRIDKLVKDLCNTTVIVPIDYAMFEARWASPFDPSNTRDGEFKVNKIKTVSVPMMYQRGYFKATSTDNNKNKIIQVPYSDNMVLLIVVPPLEKLYYLERSLTTSSVRKFLKDSNANALVDFYLPRFFIHGRIDVNDALLNMDMSSIYSSQNAVFSKITDKPKFKITDVFHQASIKVTEEGTYWIGATPSNGVKLISAVPKFKVDSPFLVIFFDKKTDTIAGIGRVTDPTSSSFHVEEEEEEEDQCAEVKGK
ncbi:alpha-1-antitrypsin-like protein GS55-MS [Hyperolius riggenbachi]|uniref:alpha-1-antitrypsin-like protein GS55-MS n=1 Tax=Hyperolius riggenbachi TaxID=752182 RepID=UPI0035A3BC4B